MRIAAVLGCVGGLVLGAAMVFPMLAQAKSCSKCVVTLSNVKHLGAGMLMYAGDHDGRFSPRDVWMDATFPYVKIWSLYRCPQAPKGGWGYAFNGALDKAKAPQSAESIPLIYDSVNPTKNASDLVTSLPRPGRHQGGNDIVYADGHAKRVRTSP